jgi:hypothetical protein
MTHPMALIQRSTASFLVVLALACHESTAPAAPAVVHFKIDATFCGASPNAYQFMIDRTVVGTETLIDGQSSQAYTTAAGQHEIDALLGGKLTLSDTTVTLTSGAAITVVVPLYCS